MKILMIGDVVGRPGRKLLLRELNNIKKELGVDFIVANLENASGGNGITEKNLKQLLNTPIDVVTMGNHTFNQRETIDYIENYPNMLRPINYPDIVPGKGYTIVEKDGVKIGVINASGQAMMGDMDSPFPIIDAILEDLEKECDIILIDFHAETTSEKIAFGYNYDGHVSGIVGTHTHVQTADNRVLPEGTAYITDLGMTGPLNGVIGVKKDIILNKLKTKIPGRFEIELEYPWQLNGALIDVDEKTGKARSIERVYRIYEDPNQ